MPAYYNEHDAQKAAWLRQLMRENLIATGEVDERSIEIVQPEEISGFTQCHFFAGIGVWSYALRNAGWSDSARVWTGSCPCPSFSTSGKGLGFDDPRHLWPAWFRLIRVVRPDVVFGEQVASDAALSWLDLVSSDLEGEDYAIGAADLCAAGVGAPHIRQRLYFVADTKGERNHPNAPRRTRRETSQSLLSGEVGDLAHPKSERRREAGREHSGRQAKRTGDASESGELGDTTIRRTKGASLNGQSRSSGESQVATGRSGLSDFWRDVEWLPCRDGKARPVEPSTFPLAHGAPARVVRLRGYGDAIVAPLAQAFIEAYSDVRQSA